MKTLLLLCCVFFGVAWASPEPLIVKHPRIINGEEVEPARYPWMVALIDPNPNERNPFCGGSLIDPEWVLTAAHCVVDEFGEPPAPYQYPDVLLDLLDLYADAGVRRSVSEVHMHPGYGEIHPSNDIALLRLSAPVTGVTPLALPGLTHDAYLVTGGEVATAMGWGATDVFGNIPSSSLLQVELPVVAPAECNRAMGYPGDPVDDSELCAGYADGGYDTCSGDSGGPLVLQMDGRWQQIGIVSWGGERCASAGEYGVYARVSRFAQWISSTLCGASTPSRPVIAIDRSRDRVTVTLQAGSAAGHRLYYAPAPAMTPIRYLDLGAARSFSTALAPGLDYFAAAQGYAGGCLSPYSTIERTGP